MNRVRVSVSVARAAAVAVPFLASLLVLPARADVKKIPVVRIHTEGEIVAPPAAVWAHLTTGKNIITWCPEWKSAKNQPINLTRVGDVLDYSDAWGNHGRSVVTYLAKDRELRVQHEPNDGSYICQAKFTLSTTPRGTMVQYWDSYTDESSAKDLDATADKMAAQMDHMMDALRRSVEKK